MELPIDLVDRILVSIESQMPEGLTLKRGPRGRAINFRVSRELAAKAHHAGPHLGLTQIGVRNRDGITSQSLAYAMWMVLDSLLMVSRSKSGAGLPWPRELAKTLEAYAETDTDGIHSWITNSAGFRIDFPLVSIEGVQMAPPSGFRLPFPLAKKYRLPPSGPITSPRNYG